MTNREILLDFYNRNLEKNRITVVKLRNDNYNVMVGPNLFVSKSGFMYYNNDDLKAECDNKFDIVEVYTKEVGGSGLDYFNTNLDFQHKFTQKVELTMQEIADKFGIDVNQLKIKK